MSLEYDDVVATARKVIAERDAQLASMLDNYTPVVITRRNTHGGARNKGVSRAQRIKLYKIPNGIIVKYLRDLIFVHMYTQKFLAAQIGISTTMLQNYINYKLRRVGWNDVEQKIIEYACTSAPLDNTQVDAWPIPTITNVYREDTVVSPTQSDDIFDDINDMHFDDVYSNEFNGFNVYL